MLAIADVLALPYPTPLFSLLGSTYLSVRSHSWPAFLAYTHTHLCSETPTLQYVRISVLYVAAWALWPMLGPV